MSLKNTAKAEEHYSEWITELNPGNSDYDLSLIYSPSFIVWLKQLLDLMLAIANNYTLIEGASITVLKQFFCYLDPPSNPAHIKLIFR